MKYGRLSILVCKRLPDRRFPGQTCMHPHEAAYEKNGMCSGRYNSAVVRRAHSLPAISSSGTELRSAGNMVKQKSESSVVLVS